MKLAKKDYALMGKVFGAEIQGRVHVAKGAQVERLEELGLVEKVIDRIDGDPNGKTVIDRMPLTYMGWALTQQGRIAYCEWAAKQPEEAK